MSYSPCQNMFSLDQKEIVLGFFGSLNYLINLHSMTNLTTNTGVLSPGVLCDVNFSAEETVICQGETIEFADNSYNGISSRTWTFNGGTATSLTDSLVSVTYDTPGVYEVSLTVSDGNSSMTETKSNYISVMADPGIDLPIVEGFEATAFTDGYNFFSTEDNITGPHWELTTDASRGGVKSVYFNNFNYFNSPVVSFHSGTIDLSVLDPDEELLLDI